jgi:hypothetical protein
MVFLDVRRRSFGQLVDLVDTSAKLATLCLSAVDDLEELKREAVARQIIWPEGRSVDPMSWRTWAGISIIRRDLSVCGLKRPEGVSHAAFRDRILSFESKQS